MLRGYFDDSGTHSESPVMCLAGYVGAEADWSSIEPQWIDILRVVDSDNPPPFHMSDLLSQSGDFALTDKPRVNYIITQCSQIIGRHSVVPFYSAVVQDDWDDAVTDAEFLQRFPDPLYLCFDDLVRQMAEWSRLKASGELIVPMFAHDSKRDKDFRSIYNAYGADDWYSSVLGPIAFGFPKQVVPLQCADLISNQMRYDIEIRRYERPVGPTAALDWATPNNPVGHWFNAAGLRLTVDRWKSTGEIYRVG